MAEADLARFIDRCTIEFVRIYPHPIERVWRAVTDQDEVGQWFFNETHQGLTAHIDPRVGGAYSLGAPTIDFKGVITAFEPPGYVRYGGPQPGAESYPDSYWEFRLETVAGGTRMVFVQRITPGSWTKHHNWPADPAEHPAGADNPWRPGTLSGWHGDFDAIGELLAGRGPPPYDEKALSDRYRQHMLATQP